MTRPDKNRNIFKCRAGEIITVKVTPENTTPLVNYALNDNSVSPAPGGDLTFTMDNEGNKNVQLTLSFTFASPAGETGNYKVEIGGDPGEYIFKRDYSGAFDIPGNAVPFFFDVE